MQQEQQISLRCNLQGHVDAILAIRDTLAQTEHTVVAEMIVLPMRETS